MSGSSLAFAFLGLLAQNITYELAALIEPIRTDFVLVDPEGMLVRRPNSESLQFKEWQSETDSSHGSWVCLTNTVL